MFDNPTDNPITDTMNFADAVKPDADQLDFSSPAPIPYAGLPLETTDNRANKAHFAMGDNSPGLEMLKSTFATDGEWSTRQKMATDADISNQQKAVDMTRRVAASAGPLTPQDIDFTMNVVKAKPVDPNTVLEKEFAKQFTHMGTTVRPDINNVFSKGWTYLPGETTFETYIATELQAKKVKAQNKLEELENKWSKTPWFNTGQANTAGSVNFNAGDSGAAVDAFAMSAVPFMSWTRLHNSLTGKDAGGIMPGTNMSNQVRALWRIPDTDEFSKTLDTHLDELWKKNPLDALVAARAAVMFSDSDELLGNVFGWADIASVVPVGALIKGARWGSSLVKGKPTSELITAKQSMVEFNPYATEPGRVGPASDLLPQDVRNAGRAIASRDPESPVMNAKRGQTFEVNRGPSMQVERGAAVEVPPNSPELQGAIQGVRDMNLPLRGPTSPSRLEPLEGDVTRQQFMGAWNRYYQRHPWNAPSDVNPDGSFPAALLPKAPYRDRAPYVDRYGEMMQGIRQGMGDVVKASGGKKIDPEFTFNYFGDVETAAKIGINRINKAQAELQASGQVKSQTPDLAGLNELSKDLPSSFNPTGLASNPSNMNRARTMTLQAQLAANGQSFLSTLSKSMGVERLPQEALDLAYKDAAQTIKFEFHTNEDHILDTVYNSRDPLPNTRSVTVQFGNRGKLPFETKQQAETFGRDILGVNPERYTVEPHQQGIGFTLNIIKPLDEGASAVRDLKIDTKFTNVPTNRWSNLIFGTWNPRSAEDLLSPFIQEAAHTATHSPQNLRAMFKGLIDENISSLPKDARNEVQDVLRAGRDYQDKGQRGKFATTVGDFEIQFRDLHGKAPTDAQTNNYFSFIQLNDMDWVLRNLGVLRDKQIKGIEQHRFSIGDGKTPWLDGKIVREFPSGVSEDSGLMIFRYPKDTPEYIRRHDAGWDINKIDKMMEEGYSLIQIAEPQKRPLMFLTGEKDVINYVLTNTKETQALPWKQMEYQPGGHVVYANNWWVKQPQIAVGRQGRAFYYGDVNLFNFSSEREAKFWSGKYEEARKILNTGDEAALDRYVTDNLPHSTAEVKELFKTHLDKEQMISHAESGMNVVRTNPEHYFNKYKDVGGLRNDLDSQFNLYQGMDKTFLADRDYQLGTVAGDGSTLKPWKIEAAKLIEPYNSLNNALGQAMRARYMQDYKIAAAQGWLQQFGHVVKDAERESFRNNPIAAIYNASFKNEAGSSVEVTMAQNARQRIIDFIGTKTEFDRNLNRIQNLVADNAYSKLGHSGADWVSEKVLPWIREPTEYARAIAFHSHLGLFNPVQLWVQSQTMANSIAIAGPVNGTLGSVMGTMMHMLSQTQEAAIIDKFANMTQKITLGKVKAADFREAYDFIQRTGIQHVGGETAWRDSVMDPDLWQSTGGKWLNKSAIFFNGGERQSRLVGGSTAFIEWRLKNPNAELTNKVMNDILYRTDTLTANMTRASNANWQKGITSVPLQFQAYASRMMEQMVGGRLTPQEKLQAFVTYSALYGVPTALGASTGMDWYTDIRKRALDNNINMDNNYVKAMSEGIPSLMFSVSTGKDYDWAKRMGPNGTMPTPMDLASMLTGGGWKPTKSIDEILGGASWQTMKDIGSTMYPFSQWAYKTIVNQDPSAMPIMLEDFAAIGSNATSWSNVMKGMYGLYAGQYITKNNVKAGDMSVMDSFMLPIFGVKPMAIETTMEKGDVEKERKAAQEKFQQLALVEYRRAMDRAWKFNDTDGMKDHMKRASVLLGSAQLNQAQQADFWKRANSGEAMTMKQKIDLDWIKNAPPDLYPERVKKGISK